MTDKRVTHWALTPRCIFFHVQDTSVKCSSSDDALSTQSHTSGMDIVTSSTPEAETVSLLKGAARTKQKSGSVVRQSGADTAVGGVLGCYGSRMVSSGVAKEEEDEELKSSAVAAAAAASVSSVRELELAAVAGRNSNGKLDNVKARWTF